MVDEANAALVHCSPWTISSQALWNRALRPMRGLVLCRKARYW
jgi:hypothetical protein